MGDGRPKHRHHRIADMLVDHAAIAVHHAIGDGEETVQHGMGFFGIHAAR